MRLACVKHAASVRSEPGSNSQVHPMSRPRPKPNQDTEQTRPRTPRLRPSQYPKDSNPSRASANNLTSVSVTHQKYTQQQTPLKQTSRQQEQSQTAPFRIIQIRTNPIHHYPQQTAKDAANVSLPSLCNCQRTDALASHRSSREAPCSRPPSLCQRDCSRRPPFAGNPVTD